METNVESLYNTFDTEFLYYFSKLQNGFLPHLNNTDNYLTDTVTQRYNTELDKIRSSYSENTEVYVSLAKFVNRKQLELAQYLRQQHSKEINTLALDLDDTLRFGHLNDNRISPDLVDIIAQFWKEDINIIISTGRPLEHIKGTITQTFGDKFVYSENVCFVYEAGAGIYTHYNDGNPKVRKYAHVEETLEDIFNHMRSQPLPENIRDHCYTQTNEFNYTLKPNAKTKSASAQDSIEIGLVYLLDLIEESISHVTGDSLGQNTAIYTHYGNANQHIRSVLQKQDKLQNIDTVQLSAPQRHLLNNITINYYKGDAVEARLTQLNKRSGVKTALNTLRVCNPSILLMGDSETDLKLMQWIVNNNYGVVATPDNASSSVIGYVQDADGVVYSPSDADDVLRAAYGLNKVIELAH